MAIQPRIGSPEALKGLNALTGALDGFGRTPTSNHNAAFTKDGSEIWTAVAGSPGRVLAGRVLVLDPQTLATLQEIAVGAGPA